MAVYTIVLFEQSPDIFHDFPTDYLHYIEAKSDTGIKVELLQKYLFIPLDIFKKNVHNKTSIDNKTEAWLRFFSMDEPEEILRLIAIYPEYKKMYEEVYQLCLNTEKVVNMFSEELRILDHATAEYMVDEMQDRINAQREEIDNLQSQNNNLQSQNDSLRQEIERLKAMIS